MAKIKSGFQGERAVILPDSIVEGLKNNELGRLLYITDIGYYPKAGFHFRKRNKQESNQFILIYCTEGEGWYEIEQIYFKINANQYFILPKGIAHSYGSNKTDPWTIYWIHFDGSMAYYFTEDLEKVNQINIEQGSRVEDRLLIFEEILASLNNGYSKCNLEYSITSLFHFLGSMKYISAFRETSSMEFDSKDMVAIAIHYMRENIHRKVNVLEIARHVAFSVSHFSAMFHKRTGFSPINYLTQLKIQQACHLLDFTDMKINQISMQFGFDDPLYFSRAFKKIMSVSPNEYRIKKKG